MLPSNISSGKRNHTGFSGYLTLLEEIVSTEEDVLEAITLDIISRAEMCRAPL